MLAFNAHFDGKVIVPDEPLDLPANQKVRIQVEPIEPAGSTGTAPKRVDISRIRGLGLRGPQNPNPRFPNDDALWGGSISDTLINDPRKKKA